MKFKEFLLLLSIILLIFSCKTKEVELVTPEPQEVVTPLTPEDPIITEEQLQEDAEYLRSINNIKTEEVVTKEEFSEDKTEILRIIQELSIIMQEHDVNSWLNYITPESKAFYSNPINLRKAQKKLPNKMLQLNSIKDYFNYVFIPSRKISKVDEIRYISKTNVKAVEVREDKSILVYYYFQKIDGKWLVNLPKL